MRRGLRRPVKLFRNPHITAWLLGPHSDADFFWPGSRLPWSHAPANAPHPQNPEGEGGGADRWCAAPHHDPSSHGCHPMQDTKDIAAEVLISYEPQECVCMEAILLWPHQVASLSVGKNPPLRSSVLHSPHQVSLILCLGRPVEDATPPICRWCTGSELLPWTIIYTGKS